MKCVLAIQFFLMFLITAMIVAIPVLSFAVAGPSFSAWFSFAVAAFWVYGVVGGVKQYIGYWQREKFDAAP